MPSELERWSSRQETMSVMAWALVEALEEGSIDGMQVWNRSGLLRSALNGCAPDQGAELSLRC